MERELISSDDGVTDLSLARNEFYRVRGTYFSYGEVNGSDYLWSRGTGDDFL